MKLLNRALHTTIQPPISYRLTQVRRSDLSGVIQIGNCACYFENTVIGARRESQLFDGALPFCHVTLRAKK